MNASKISDSLRKSDRFFFSIGLNSEELEIVNEHGIREQQSVRHMKGRD